MPRAVIAFGPDGEGVANLVKTTITATSPGPILLPVHAASEADVVRQLESLSADFLLITVWSAATVERDALDILEPLASSADYHLGIVQNRTSVSTVPNHFRSGPMVHFSLGDTANSSNFAGTLLSTLGTIWLRSHFALPWAKWDRRMRFAKGVADAVARIAAEKALRRIEKKLTPAPILAPFALDPSRRGIFLSYRRDDAQDAAGRLHDALLKAYNKERIFFDVESIPAGAKFQKHIEKRIQQCGVGLALIGRNWLNMTDRLGRRRLDDPLDPVRFEIATMLRQTMQVAPVLVHNAAMPMEADLPEDIRGLVAHNGIKLSAESWGTEVARLMKDLANVIPTDS